MTNLDVKKKELEARVKCCVTLNDIQKNETNDLKNKLYELAEVSKPSVETKATNTDEVNIISKASIENMCNHSVCFIRQPKSPPTYFPPKNFYLSPPKNIRLLPYQVSSYQDFESLNVRHECNECDTNSLFFNYHEIVQYQEPDGTRGSQVRSCPNHPNSVITIESPNDKKTRNRRRTFKCHLCNESSSTQLKCFT